MPVKIDNGIYQQTVDANEKHGNQAKAAEALGVPRETFKSRLKEAQRRGFKPGVVFCENPDTDPLNLRQLRNSVKIERARAEHAEALALAGRSLREAAFGLSERAMTPPHWNPKANKKGRAETIVLFLSDLQVGEAISIEMMGGRNSFSMAIAKKRCERYFQNVVGMATEHWSGPAPDAIYLVLGGDLISGNIHDELMKTNDLLAIPSVPVVAEMIAAGIGLLRRTFPDLTINVISLPGNHGRDVKKPEAKAFAINSYDTLVAWCVESWAKASGLKNVTFSAPLSGDALVNIHGWNLLFTHGDRIGSRGGQGYVGTAATATRGMKKIIEDFLIDGEIVDYVIMGHFHTPMELEYGFVNGSLPGPSEYSRSGRMRSHPASQWMLTVHPSYGIARRWKIQVGDPSEGSIYRGRT